MSFNDICVTSYDNLIQFEVEEIKKATKSINKSQACDYNEFNLDNICKLILQFMHSLSYLTLCCSLAL